MARRVCAGRRRFPFRRLCASTRFGLARLCPKTVSTATFQRSPVPPRMAPARCGSKSRKKERLFFVCVRSVWQAPHDQSSSRSIDKSPTADWFRLTFIWRDGPPELEKEQRKLGYYGSGVWEYYLFDRDGSPVRRFTDWLGDPALVGVSSSLSDTHATGGQGSLGPDGTRRGYVFELPALPSTAASPSASTNNKPGRAVP